MVNDMNDATVAPPAPRILTRADGAAIAYHKTPGKSPGVIFMAGFMSDMTSGKAQFIEAWCKARGQACLRFDYFGCGASSGTFTEGTIGRWAEDAVAVLDDLTEGPQVLVGSSMGGWIVLLAALARPQRVAGLVGIAPAPDFTEDLLVQGLSAGQRASLERDGVVYVHSLYGPEPTPFTQDLVDDGRRHLVLRRKISLTCPVRILHGMRDPDVPWQTSLRLCQMLESDDVEIQFVKAGDHRLSEPHDLARLGRTLGALLDAPAE
jgi:pimeloyl-ACP methyl ester carboxylesterase